MKVVGLKSTQSGLKKIMYNLEYNGKRKPSIKLNI